MCCTPATRIYHEEPGVAMATFTRISKGKFVPVLNQAAYHEDISLTYTPYHEDIQGSGGTAPHIVDLRTTLG